jgi:DNA-binding beta-propeller fold protein YncE
MGARSVAARRALCFGVAAICLALALARPAAASTCAQALADSIVLVPVPGHPFQVVASPDGCWFYVSLNAGGPDSVSGIGVLKRENGTTSMVRVVRVEPQPAGMVVTRDGALLVVTNGDEVVFLDAMRMQTGEGDPVLGRLGTGAGAGSVYINITRDDRTLFVSDEHAQRISVIDVARARSDGFKPNAIVGRIPVGRAPIALTFSSDERFLFTTSQMAPKEWGWKPECLPEGQSPAASPALPTDPPGAVVVIDVERATREPAKAVVARVPAGCHPVRLALSPGGDRAYVTARKSNELIAFDTAKLAADGAHARLGSAAVGPAPVGVAVGRAGGRDVVVVANSNRFATAGAESLSVIDAASIATGAGAVIGHIPAGSFPRELRLIDGGRTLVVTNYLSDTVEFVDLERASRSWVRP